MSVKRFPNVWASCNFSPEISGLFGNCDLELILPFVAEFFLNGDADGLSRQTFFYDTQDLHRLY